MPDTILVCVAWPYANTPLHAGQVAGAYLPADIFARYHRMRGNRVLMVSGSDAHGTPITVRAEQEGTTPQAVMQRNHASFVDTFERFGVSFDLFTSTATENHARVAQEMFRKLQDAGYIYPALQRLLYDPKVGRFLPDRYVEGTCPRCGDPGARGDQCDNCGSTLDALELLNPRSKLSDATPEPRPSKHFFLKLSEFNVRLKEWVEAQTHWRPAVRNFTLGLLREGLHDRAITRDIEWGIPVPADGFEGKVLYVWFEAVIGYLSASIEWAQTSGDPEAWRAFWEEPTARAYYFQGKDNVPFHTTIWPAMLMGSAEATSGSGGTAVVGGKPLNLPYDVPANQYVTMSGAKASSSRNWAVWMPDYLDRHAPDPLRYVLSAIMPETSDSDFSWAEYLRRNNDELVATWGNLVHRVLTFTRRNFDARVPEPPPVLSEASTRILARVDAAFAEAGAHIEAVQLRAALQTAMSVAQDTNRYLDDRAPWVAIKQDRDSAAETLWTAINVISGLATMFQPFMPFTSPQAWALAGNTGEIQPAGWRRSPVAGGTALPEPSPLFQKFDDTLVEEEEARLGK